MGIDIERLKTDPEYWKECSAPEWATEVRSIGGCHAWSGIGKYKYFTGEIGVFGFGATSMAYDFSKTELVIKRPAAAQWVDGIPPVGVECEVHNEECYELSEYGESFIGKEVVICAVFKNVNGVSIAAASAKNGDCVCLRVDMFRPLRTGREEFIGDVRSVLNGCDGFLKYADEISGQIYEAIKSGKLKAPEVK